VQCPYCGNDSSVTETRVVSDGLRRRRMCGTCKRRFTTYEKVGAASLRVQKRNGHVEPFDSEKLVRALARIGRRRANVQLEDARRIARDIEANLVDSGRKIVTWSDIVAAALTRLRAIDSIAANRMTANYLDDNGNLKLEGSETLAPDQPQLGLPGVDDDL
jgi:transcriptional repressor NrdR